jgi:transposase-like protein
MANTLTIQDFLKRFPDDAACLDHLMKVRYGNTLLCPKCGKEGAHHRLKKEPAYVCQWCGHHVHPMVGTMFMDSRTPLAKWFYAIYLFTTTRHGVPAKELQRQLGVTYKTAFRMAHLIRLHMAGVDGDNGLSGHVELDETYIGGRQKGKGRGRRTGDNKTVVFGMLQRGGDVMTRVVPNAKRATLEPHIREHVAAGSTISTDEHNSYKFLKKAGYKHGQVWHTVEKWVDGIHHTNGIEGFWGQIKRSIRGTHVHVSAKHLSKYLGEFEFRYNLRHAPELMLERLVASF